MCASRAGFRFAGRPCAHHYQPNGAVQSKTIFDRDIVSARGRMRHVSRVLSIRPQAQIPLLHEPVSHVVTSDTQAGTSLTYFYRFLDSIYFDPGWCSIDLRRPIPLPSLVFPRTPGRAWEGERESAGNRSNTCRNRNKRIRENVRSIAGLSDKRRPRSARTRVAPPPGSLECVWVFGIGLSLSLSFSARPGEHVDGASLQERLSWQFGESSSACGH